MFRAALAALAAVVLVSASLIPDDAFARRGGGDLCGLFSHEAFPAGKIATASCPNSSSNQRSVGISATSRLLGVTHTVRRCAGRNEDMAHR